MLSVCPSIVTFKPGLACSFITASSRILIASGLRFDLSKSNRTSSNTIWRRITGMVMEFVAVPPRPSFAVTVSGKLPSWFGAVQIVFMLFGGLKVPAGAVQAYVIGSPSGSVAGELRFVDGPGSKMHGLHCTGPVNCGGLFAGGGGGGGGAGTSRTTSRTCGAGGGGGTYVL